MLLLALACVHHPTPAPLPLLPFGTDGDVPLDADELRMVASLSAALGVPVAVDPRLSTTADRAAAAEARTGVFPSASLPDWVYRDGVVTIPAVEARHERVARGEAPPVDRWAEVVRASAGAFGPVVGVGRAPVRRGAVWVVIPAGGNVGVSAVPRDDGPHPITVTGPPDAPLVLAWAPDGAAPVGEATGTGTVTATLPAGVRAVQVLTTAPGSRVEVARFRTAPPDPTDHAPAAIRAEIDGWRAAAGVPPLADVGAAPCPADEATDGTRLTRTWRCWAWPANPARGGGVAWGEVADLPVLRADALLPTFDALGLEVSDAALAVQLRQRLAPLDGAGAAALVRALPSHAAATEDPAASAALADRLGGGTELSAATADALRDWALSGALFGGGGTTWFAVGFGADAAAAVRAAVANVDGPVGRFAVAARSAHTDELGWVVVVAVASTSGP